MKRLLMTAAFASVIAAGGAFAQTQPANPVDGSGNPRGPAAVDGAGTKAMKKDSTIKGSGSTVQRSGASSDPVEGSGSAANDQKIDPAGTKAAKQDNAIKGKGSSTTTGASVPNRAPAKDTGPGASGSTNQSGGAAGAGSGAAGGSGNSQ